VSNPESDPDVRLTAWVHGIVQGVGFRWWTRSRALELGLTGYAANQADGRVLVIAQGPREAAEKLLQLLEGGGPWPPRPGRVDKVVADWSQPQERFSGFVER
jgi:acylphosphatase